MALAQDDDFSATLTQEECTKNLKFPPTPRKSRVGRKGPLSEDETKMRQRELGELRRMATASRPDARAMSAKIASRINPLCGSDVYRINDLARAVNGVESSGGVEACITL